MDSKLTDAQANRIIAALDPSDSGHDVVSQFVRSLVQSDLRLAAQIRNLVIEECAVICEQYSREHGGWVARQEDAIACAALIRAAKH